MQLDYLIIGQGLAGSILALQLLQRNKRVLVIDNGYESSSSYVAAGMINPIAGQRMAKAWLVDEALPSAYKFYQHYETIFENTFIHQCPIKKFLVSELEVTRYQERSQDPAYDPYHREWVEADRIQSEMPGTFGRFTICQGGFLRVKRFLNGAKKFLQSHQAYTQKQLDYTQLKPAVNAVQFEDITAKRVIFCEGWKGKDNPWFNWLTFNCAKGEILTLKTQSELAPEIVNKGRWVLPTDAQTLKVGSTYTRTELNNNPSIEAKDSLFEFLNDVMPNIADATLAFHEAGVRPLAYDNRPFVGTHPELPALGFFNGFGSKGTLSIPLLAQHFIEHLETASPLYREADIMRVWKKRNA